MNISNYTWDVPVENKTSFENFLSTSPNNPLQFSIFRPLCYFHFPRFNISKLPIEYIEKLINMNHNVSTGNYNGSRFSVRNENFGTIIYDKKYFRYYLINESCKNILKSHYDYRDSHLLKGLSPLLRLADIPLKELAEVLYLCDKENFHYYSPFKIFFEITTNCNMNCRHCLNKNSRRKSINMTTEMIYQYLDWFQEQKIFEVNLTGGEPFLHPDISDILSYAIKIFPGLTISTNGTILNNKILSVLRDINLRYLNISLDGTEKTYKNVRHNYGFDEIINNIIFASQYVHDIGITITLNRYNIQEIEDIIKLAILNNIHKINFGIVKYTNNNNNDDLLVESPRQLYENIKKIDTLCTSNNILYYLPPDLPYNTIQNQNYNNLFFKQKFCLAGIFTLKILSDQTIIPCIFSPQKLTSDIKNVGITRAFQEIREQVQKKANSNIKCDFFKKKCMGGCLSRYSLDTKCDKYCMKDIDK